MSHPPAVSASRPQGGPQGRQTGGQAGGQRFGQPGVRQATASRGRHASAKGDGFGQLMALTTIGALLPGSGLLAAGRRRSGTVILSCVVAVVAVLVTLVLTGRAFEALLWLAVRPRALMVLAGLLVAAGLGWALVIVVSHAALRPPQLATAQRVLSALLVVALVAMVLVPTGRLAQYALVQRDLVDSLFADLGDDRRRVGAATPDLRAGADPWAGVPRVNVLLLGSDAGEGRTGVRPDTIIVASIDTATGDTLLLSVPRNLEQPPFAPGSPGEQAWPEGFDAEEGLINAVWTWGESNPQLFPGDPNPGLTATRDAVSGVLGLDIDYYAIVNLDGFQDFVDAMGGVTVDVQRDIPIGGGFNQITGRNNPVNGYIRQGRRNLDGYEALWFARSRHQSDDYDRIRRQRCLIGAVIEQADPPRLALAFPRLAASAQDNVSTDIRRPELDAWVELALRVKDATVRSLPFTDDVIVPGNPDYEQIHELVQAAIDPAPPTTAPEPEPSTPRVAPEPVPTDPQTPTEEPTIDPERPAEELGDVC